MKDIQVAIDGVTVAWRAPRAVELPLGGTVSERGHVFDEANSRIGRDGVRHCRACCRENMARHRERRRTLEQRADASGGVR